MSDLSFSTSGAKSRDTAQPVGTSGSPKTSQNNVWSGFYRYQPLPEGRWIRLLRLFPGQTSDQVSYELISIKLDESPAYDAISYAWGNPRDRYSALNSGKLHLITRSLYTGLKRFRHQSKTRLLWADAACINQHDDFEKSQQVIIMHSIYYCAKKVLVWLGEADDFLSSTAFQYIRNTSSALEQKAVQWEVDYNKASDFLSSLGKTINLKQAYSEKPVRQALETLSSCGWFSRIWVLQEVALASTCIMYWGSSCIEFSDFIVVCLMGMILPDFADGMFPIASAFQGVNTVIFNHFTSKKTWISDRSLPKLERGIYTSRYPDISLTTLLMVGSRFNSSDPRDHVYALLGHPRARLEDGVTSVVKVDYTLSKLDIYKQLVRNVCTLDQRVDILSMVSHPVDVDFRHTVSWVPRFDVSFEHNGISSISFRADGYLKHSMNIQFRDDTMENLGAHLFGSVRLTSNILSYSKPLPQGSVDPVQHCWELLLSVSDANYQIRPRTDSLYLTLILRRYHGGDSSGRRDFKAYCKTRFHPATWETMRRTHPFLDNIPDDGSAEQFATRIERKTQNKIFFVTTNGFHGLCADIVRPGDICSIILGCRVPLILRKTSVKGQYSLLGCAYIDEVNNGELMDAPMNELRKSSSATISLV
jgi:hypothetical protein